jgi:hypothetical protein
MLLAVLSVWGSQSQKDIPPPTYVYKIPLDSQLWHLLDDDVLDRTWLVRNLLGGMSAGFGLRGVCVILSLGIRQVLRFSSGAGLPSLFYRPCHFLGLGDQN